VTLRSIEAKSARFMVLAARAGCRVVNLSTGPSRLVFPRANRHSLEATPLIRYDDHLAERALKREAALGYRVPSGRYWEEAHRFDPAQIDALDTLWRDAAEPEAALLS
jgi:hypothetical protein